MSISSLVRKTRADLYREFGVEASSELDDEFMDEDTYDGKQTSYIKKAFSTIPIRISSKEILDVERHVIEFEMRSTHPAALNSQFIAVDPMVFLPSDRIALFEIFGVREKQFVDVINKIPSIDKKRHVTSDAYNLFVIWLIHLATVLIRDAGIRHRFMMNVVKMLHYKFFTSYVKKVFPHGATESRMALVVSGLSKKFDIVTLGTWRRVIEKRCGDFITQPLHMDYISKGDNDGKLLYALSDAQTRIRFRVRLIQIAYYEHLKSGVELGSRTAVRDGEDGEKMIVQSVSAFDTMITNTFTEMTSVSSFVNRQAIISTVNQFPSISVSLLSTLLERVSQLAQEQLRKGTASDRTGKGDNEIITGLKELVSIIIQGSYRYVVRNGVPMSSKGIVYKRIKDAYGSSRINDKQINIVRRSVSEIVDTHSSVVRDATKSSLKLALVMYIILKSMQFY